MLKFQVDESPLVYRATVVSDDSNFDLSTALFHVTMYRQFARKVGTSANSALIRYYLPRLNCLARLALARERTPSLLLKLSEPFFDTTVRPRPNLARMCG